MNILVVDGERRLLELLRNLLEGEGHQVAVADDLLRAGALIRSRLPEMLVLSVHLSKGSGLQLLHELRDQPGGRSVFVVLTGSGRGGGDRAVARAMEECRVDHLLRKPFPMFDLLDLVREAAAGSGASDSGIIDEEPVHDPLSTLVSANVPAMSDPISPRKTSEVHLPRGASYVDRALHRDNLQRLAGLWVRRASGVVTLQNGPSGARGWMAMGEGGPLDSDGWELLSAALHGGQMTFERREVPGAGDQLGLGAMIFGRVRDPARVDFLDEARMKALMPPRHPAPLLGLPLQPESRWLIETVDPSVPLGERAATGGVDLVAAGPDLEALQRMGLLELGLPMMREGTSGGFRPRGVTARRVRDESPTETYAVVGDETPSVAERLRARREAETSSSMSTVTGRSQRRRSSATAQRDEARNSEVIARRLRREASLIGHEGPEVILGVPGDADPELVGAAHARMTARYQQIAQDKTLPPSARDDAQRLLQAVEDAKTALLSGRSRRPVEVVPEEERLLHRGRDYVAREEWPAALAALRRARDLRLDHPGILANLGWATLHDPQLDEIDREEEARGLLALAVQFAPDDPEGNLYYARFLETQDDPERALPYARRALAANPEDGPTQRLVARLQRAVATPG